MPRDESLEAEKKRNRKEAGLDDPNRGKSYTSPGGFIKIPTPNREPGRHKPPAQKKK